MSLRVENIKELFILVKNIVNCPFNFDINMIIHINSTSTLLSLLIQNYLSGYLLKYHHYS